MPFKKYDVIQISEVEKLIFPVTKGNTIKYKYLFNIINEVHLSIGHGDRNRMEYEIKIQFINVTRESIMIY